MIEHLDEGLAEVVGWGSWWSGCLIGVGLGIGGLGRAPGAGDVPELPLLRLPYSVVVWDSFAGLEGEELHLGRHFLGHLVPCFWDFFEDGGVA
jgi:hypothetical protein